MNNPQLVIPIGGAASVLPLKDADVHPLRHARVLVAGLGNIGSYLAFMLAPLASRLRLVDRDRVEHKNVENQLYSTQHLKRSKVSVIAAEIAKRFPHVEVEQREVDLEDLPIGDFSDVDVCFGALDSLRARQVLAEHAYRHGAPLIDGAVGEPMLGRVSLLLPESACMECSWGRDHYRQLAREYPCHPGGSLQVPSTRSPAALGAFVAGLMTAELIRLFSEHRRTQSHELYFDLLGQRFVCSRLKKSARCRFDHQVIRTVISNVEDFAALTFGDVVTAAKDHFPCEALTFHSRRKLFPGAGLFGRHSIASIDELRKISDTRLVDAGLTPQDRILIDSGAPAAYLVFRQGPHESRYQSA